jgi:hypothetical protein
MLVLRIFRFCENDGKIWRDWETVFSEYEKSRKPNADAIAELSYRNF